MPVVKCMIKLVDGATLIHSFKCGIMAPTTRQEKTARNQAVSFVTLQ